MVLPAPVPPVVMQQARIRNAKGTRTLRPEGVSPKYTWGPGDSASSARTRFVCASDACCGAVARSRRYASVAASRCREASFCTRRKLLIVDVLPAEPVYVRHPRQCAGCVGDVGAMQPRCGMRHILPGRPTVKVRRPSGLRALARRGCI